MDKLKTDLPDIEVYTTMLPLHIYRIGGDSI